MEIIIIITKSSKGFTVHYEDKKADRLCWEEMLGVLTALTFPEDRKFLNWLRTEKQEALMEEYYANIGKETNKEFTNISQEGTQC